MCESIYVKDGITMRILRSDYDACIKASDDLMKEINMSYEANTYQRMVIRDVNNYSSQYVGGGIKHKGAFEIDKDLHKDPSMRIVSIALEKYFFENIPVKKTIENHKNIYDFCMRLKVDSRFTTEYHYIEEENLFKSNVSDYEKELVLENCLWIKTERSFWAKREWIDNQIAEESEVSLNEAYAMVQKTNNNPTKTIKEMPKTLRYFVSKKGGSLYKRTNLTGKKTGVNIGYVTTEFNKYYKAPMEDYGINYQFYISEANKIIDTVEDKQLTLF